MSSVGSTRLFGAWGALLIVVAWAPGAHASGLALTDQSASALSRAGAVSANIDDASAVYHSPASIAFGVGPTHASHAATATLGLVTARTRFDSALGGPPTFSQRQLRPVPAIFASAHVHPRVAIGLGLHAPFGFAMQWPDAWIGAQQSLRSLVLVTAANPIVAWRVHDDLSVAFGVSLLRGDVEMGLALPELVGGRADLDADAFGLSWNAAALWRGLEHRLRVAFSFRSGANLDLQGQANFATPPAFQDTFPDGPARASFPLPSMFTLGVAGRVLPTVDVSLDLTRTQWSVFDELLIDLEHFDPLIQRESRDTYSVAGGVDWTPTALPVALRMGLRFEQSVTDADALSPSTPDGDRVGLATGLRWQRPHLVVDLGYLYTHFLDAEAENAMAGPPGRYRTRLHALALSVTVR